MNLLDRDSLGATLDALSAALFFGDKLPARECAASVRWIASRQGLPGAYAEMFAPTPRDLHGIRLFTGERVTTRAGIAHVLGEESCRVLATLRGKDRAVRATLARALEGMTARFERETQRGYGTGGFYCCGTCSASYWRNLVLGSFPQSDARLRQGLAELRALRHADGQWRRFPFFYTSLVLSEIGPERAGDEMHHAASRWRRILPRLAASDEPFARRRAEVGRRLLALVEP